MQIVTIALAPILGFSGVAVGVFLKDRSDHSASLRAERRAAYANFLRAMTSWHECFAIKGKNAFESKDEIRIQAYRDEMYGLRLDLKGVEHEVALVGSVQAIKAAESIAKVTIDMDVAESAAHKKGYDQKL